MENVEKQLPKATAQVIENFCALWEADPRFPPRRKSGCQDQIVAEALGAAAL
jgi:hypothetical protein